MVALETKPNRYDYDLHPVRILHSGCTLDEAKETFEQLAYKTHEEGSSKNNVEDEMILSSDGNESSTSEECGSKSVKRKKRTNSGTKVKAKKSAKKKKDLNTLDENVSFEFGSELDEKEKTPRTPVRTSVKEPTTAASTSNQIKDPVRSVASRSLFPAETSQTQDNITRGEFEVFEKKLFYKLNTIQQMLCDLNTRSATSSARELIKFPTVVSDKVTLPATDVKSLETLDKVLADEATRTELASYLSQLGGKKHSDFLGRALPKVLSDEVCYLTNWSGSQIPPGSVDMRGNAITREFKKTFSNLTNVVDMFCCATQLVCTGATNQMVESYIQKWLVAFKDRVVPRKHLSQSQPQGTDRAKKSPRKRKGH